MGWFIMENPIVRNGGSLGLYSFFRRPSYTGSKQLGLPNRSQIHSICNVITSTGHLVGIAGIMDLWDSQPLGPPGHQATSGNHCGGKIFKPQKFMVPMTMAIEVGVLHLALDPEINLSIIILGFP